MPTRPCEYCLALQDGSVFADFDINQNGQLFLIRISFDSYGCCHPSAEIKELDNEKSLRLIRSIDSGIIETPEVIEILKNYFRENKAALWEDALIHHELI